MKNNSWIFIALIIVSIWFFQDHKKLKEEAQGIRERYYECDSSLRLANSRIEDANNMINNAKMMEGSSYDDMEWALSNLEEVETVPTP